MSNENTPIEGARGAARPWLEDDRPYTSDEAGLKIGGPGKPLDRRTIQELRNAGLLRAVRVGRRSLRFMGSEIRRFLEDSQERGR